MYNDVKLFPFLKQMWHRGNVSSMFSFSSKHVKEKRTHIKLIREGQGLCHFFFNFSFCKITPLHIQYTTTCFYTLRLHLLEFVQVLNFLVLLSNYGVGGVVAACLQQKTAHSPKNQHVQQWRTKCHILLCQISIWPLTQKIFLKKWAWSWNLK